MKILSIYNIIYEIFWDKHLGPTSPPRTEVRGGDVGAWVSSPCPPSPPQKKNPSMPAGLSVEVISISTVTVLPNTAVFFHGTYRGAQSVVPPNTNQKVNGSSCLVKRHFGNCEGARCKVPSNRGVLVNGLLASC